MEDEGEEKMEKWKMEKWKMEASGTVRTTPGLLPRTLHCNAGARGLTLNRTTNRTTIERRVTSPACPSPSIHAVRCAAGGKKRTDSRQKKEPQTNPTRKGQNPAGRDSWENLPSTTTT